MIKIDELFINSRVRPSRRNTENDARNEFESDFGRIIFSPAVRRMHDKTQVFPLTTDDNIHSRLTHSLEVMAVGESIVLNLIKDTDFLKKISLSTDNVKRSLPILIKNACLIHDIGNPPFGHFGEEVISQYFTSFFSSEDNEVAKKLRLSKKEKEDFIFFDGNAQGFRVLTKLQALDDSYGLNLTIGTLSSFLKYPNDGKKIAESVSHKKRGVFQSEKNLLKQIILETKLKFKSKNIRNPLAFIMEAADSICYLIMDIEDGFNKKWYNFQIIQKETEHIPGFKEMIYSILKESKSESSKIVNFRLGVLKILINLAVSNFKENYDKICQGEYNKELIFDDPNNLAEVLKKFTKKYIFQEQEITSLELTGHSVLTGLLDFYINSAYHSSLQYKSRIISLISTSIIRAAGLEQNILDFDFYKYSDYYKLRVIVDFISGMTDQFALNHFQKLSGQKI